MFWKFGDDPLDLYIYIYIYLCIFIYIYIYISVKEQQNIFSGRKITWILFLG